VTASFVDGEVGNFPSTGWLSADGYGLINAVAAVQAVAPPPPSSKAATENQASSK
jgi:hypothetical protein